MNLNCIVLFFSNQFKQFCAIINWVLLPPSHIENSSTQLQDFFFIETARITGKVEIKLKSGTIDVPKYIHNHGFCTAKIQRTHDMQNFSLLHCAHTLLSIILSY